jgi:hypothetical protein
LPSDAHDFIGRIYDLSVVGLRFDSYDELSRYPDCKYTIDVNYDLSRLVQRVESLNMAGKLVWMDPIPRTFKDFPVSRYDWLTIGADVFLMRYISVVDCAIIVTNTVFQAELNIRKCTIENLRKKNVPEKITEILKTMIDNQGALRSERNSRFHHGVERNFTDDDVTFRVAAQFEHFANGITGTDRFDRNIDVEQSFREGLVSIQRDFNSSCRDLNKYLNRLYSVLHTEFEDRFGLLIRNATHGFNMRNELQPHPES